MMYLASTKQWGRVGGECGSRVPKTALRSWAEPVHRQSNGPIPWKAGPFAGL